MFIVWTFFLLLNAFYGGALTMFFTSKPALPFTTVRQGLSDEDWKMIMVDGMQGGDSLHFYFLLSLCQAGNEKQNIEFHSRSWSSSFPKGIMLTLCLKVGGTLFMRQRSQRRITFSPPTRPPYSSCWSLGFSCMEMRMELQQSCQCME